MKQIIAPAPHIRDEGSVPAVMYVVIAALMPAAVAGVYFFGWRAMGLVLTCVITAVVTEYILCRVMKKGSTVGDGSAALTGLLLAMCLSPSMPFFAAVLGTVFAVAVGKQIFGGLGYNIFNPALIGRAFLAAAFPVQMTSWLAPLAQRGVDAVSTATPLAVMKFQHQSTSFWQLLLGNTAGCLGETSALLILLPALFLVWRGLINWRIPVSYLGTVVVLGGLFWLINPAIYPDPVFHLLAGGLMLGACFMATDPVTSPVTKRGMLFFGCGAGLLVVIIRLFSGLPEGVMYSILIMNALVPLINRYTRPRILGKAK